MLGMKCAECMFAFPFVSQSFMERPLIIGIVGPCASGKTTLRAELLKYGYEVKHIAQEHSYVADMWKRLTNPEILIYLDVSYSNTIKRCKLNWTIEEFEVQVMRLLHARRNADFYLNTDDLTPEQVRNCVIEYISARQNTNNSHKENNS